MLDKADSSRPERRSALVAHELSRLNIDITALSEVRLADEGSLGEHGAGYTLYWSGKPSTERRLSGVGFMVRNSIASKLDRLPTGHSDRIMSMHLLLEGKQHLTLPSVAVSTQTKEERQSQEETQRRQPVPGGGGSQVPSRRAANCRRIPLHK